MSTARPPAGPSAPDAPAVRDATTPGAPRTPLDAPAAPDALAFAKVLADDTRQRIMTCCCCGWRSVGDIVAALGGDVAQPTVSHHLAVLRAAGLVRQRRAGRQAFYTLDQGRVALCCGQVLASFAPETGAAAAVVACCAPAGGGGVAAEDDEGS